MIRSMVCMPLDMRVDILDEVDRGPGRSKQYLVIWTEMDGATWMSPYQLQCLEQLIEAWEQPPRG